MTGIIEFFKNMFTSSINGVPEQYQILMGLFLYILFILIYSAFVWKFHKIISKREFSKSIKEKYFSSENPFSRGFYFIFFIIEYLIILPILSIFWFAIFSILLLILTKTSNINDILLISASVLVSIRIIAYVQEDLARNLSKIFPFSLLAIFFTGISSIRADELMGKVIEIPSLLNNIIPFALFIFITEFILRIFYLILRFTKSKIISKQSEVINKPARKVFKK